MAQSNLTRDDAQIRAARLSVSSYDITLDLTDGGGKPGERTFRSRTVITFDSTTPGESTFLDLVADSFTEATLNGVALDTSAYTPEVGLVLPDLAEHNEVVVDAQCLYSHSGEGLHRFTDSSDGEVYLYSQFETANANQMYACFDQPDLKAEFTFHVTAPSAWSVVSNGAVASTEDGPGGSTVTHFLTTKRMSPYITALIAGPYHSVRDTYTGANGHSIDLGIYVRGSLAKHLDAEAIFTITKQGFAFFEDLFAFPYPFGKYDQLFVPEFNFGAMENAGAITFRDDYIFQSKVTEYRYERRAETILHEMAHMWFGDLVTMRWWDDLWLNESFATYASVHCQAEATQYTDAWTTFANIEKTWAYDQDSRSSTHPISADASDIRTVETNFDGITYAKGASVLKQLVAYVGQDAFFAALRQYFQANQFGNTSLADLFSALEETSGRDLSDWSAQWLETSQVNTLRPDFTVDDAGNFLTFAVAQSAVPEHPTLRTHRMAIGLYDVQDGALVRTQRIELDVSGARTDVPDLVGVRQPDLVLLNDDDLAYAKIRFDPRSLATLVSHVDAFTESLPRALCWSAAWDMTRDAELATRDFLALVLRGIPAEPTMSVIQSLLAYTQTALVMYADPQWAPTGWTQLADAAWRHLQDSAPGSDQQVLWSRTFANAATTDAQLDALAAVVAGTTPIPGLAMDLDSRWALLTPLVAAGRAGDTEIAAELERDGADAAQRKAATARSIRPTAEAKAEAWRLTVETDDLTNYLHEATALGFYQRTQTDLTRPYRPKYFAALAEVWKDRAAAIAQQTTELLFPRIVEPETVAAADEWLTLPDLSSAQKRLVAEQRDSIVRALKCRAKDAEA